MKIILAGGSGQVGTILARALHSADHKVVVLSRNPKAAPWRVVSWDGRTAGSWTNEMEGADVLINLAGKSVNCRYGRKNREEIMDSRLQSTRLLGGVLARAANPPKVWLQASTATIYAHRFDAANDEATGIIGGNEPNSPDTWRFSIDVATSWENTAREAVTPRTRMVLMRSAIVMSPDGGGAFNILLRLARFGLGGKNGDGRQYISWIHERDFVRAVLWLIAREDIEGVVNLASPHPLPNAEFMRDLRHAWGRRVGLPAARWMLEVGAFFLRTETELILKSRRVVPGRLSAGGFTFDFPEWPGAAKDLCERWRAAAR